MLSGRVSRKNLNFKLRIFNCRTVIYPASIYLLVALLQVVLVILKLKLL